MNDIELIVREIHDFKKETEREYDNKVDELMKEKREKIRKLESFENSIKNLINKE